MRKVTTNFIASNRLTTTSEKVEDSSQEVQRAILKIEGETDVTVFVKKSPSQFRTLIEYACLHIAKEASNTFRTNPLQLPETKLILDGKELVALASYAIEELKLPDDLSLTQSKFENILKKSGHGAMQALRYFLADVDGTMNWGLTGEKTSLACIDFGLSFYSFLDQKGYTSDDEKDYKKHLLDHDFSLDKFSSLFSGCLTNNTPLDKMALPMDYFTDFHHALFDATPERISGYISEFFQVLQAVSKIDFTEFLSELSHLLQPEDQENWQDFIKHLALRQQQLIELFSNAHKAGKEIESFLLKNNFDLTEQTKEVLIQAITQTITPPPSCSTPERAKSATPESSPERVLKDITRSKNNRRGQRLFSEPIEADSNEIKSITFKI